MPSNTTTVLLWWGNGARGATTHHPQHIKVGRGAPFEYGICSHQRTGQTAERAAAPLSGGAAATRPQSFYAGTTGRLMIALNAGSTVPSYLRQLERQIEFRPALIQSFECALARLIEHHVSCRKSGMAGFLHSPSVDVRQHRWAFSSSFGQRRALYRLSSASVPRPSRLPR
jgi:hypothetical protein